MRDPTLTRIYIISFVFLVLFLIYLVFEIRESLSDKNENKVLKSLTRENRLKEWCNDINVYK